MANAAVSRRYLEKSFRAIVGLCAAFFVLSVTAMLVYPGGRVGNPRSSGYAFFTNFFSDLGTTRTHGGHSNVASLVLFCAALAATAIAVALFFATFSLLFKRATTPRRLAFAGALCGVAAGVCFAGVAATPWNLFLSAHNAFVLWAFRAFFGAVALTGLACFFAPRVFRRFANVFAGFAVLLAIYIAVLTFGPPPGTATGAAIQATAQKIIVYASVLTVLVQTLGTGTLLRGRVVGDDGLEPPTSSL